MDVDPVEDILDDGRDQEKAHGRLNTYVAIAVALLATFMGICNVKDDNIVQGMQAAQAKSVDDWNYYQARRIREEVASATADQIRLQAAAQPPAAREAFNRMAEKYAAIAKEQKEKQAGTRADAETDQKTYDALNFHDDQFDLSSALVSLAIALLALTALTHKRWLFGLAMVPTFFGVLMGMAGLLGWHIHPAALTRLLS